MHRQSCEVQESETEWFNHPREAINYLIGNYESGCLTTELTVFVLNEWET